MPGPGLTHKIKSAHKEAIISPALESKIIDNPHIFTDTPQLPESFLNKGKNSLNHSLRHFNITDSKPRKEFGFGIQNIISMSQSNPKQETGEGHWSIFNDSVLINRLTINKVLFYLEKNEVESQDLIIKNNKTNSQLTVTEFKGLYGKQSRVDNYNGSKTVDDNKRNNFLNFVQQDNKFEKDSSKVKIWSRYRNKVLQNQENTDESNIRPKQVNLEIKIKDESFTDKWQSQNHTPLPYSYTQSPMYNSRTETPLFDSLKSLNNTGNSLINQSIENEIRRGNRDLLAILSIPPMLTEQNELNFDQREEYQQKYEITDSEIFQLEFKKEISFCSKNQIQNEKDERYGRMIDFNADFDDLTVKPKNKELEFNICMKKYLFEMSFKTKTNIKLLKQKLPKKQKKKKNKNKLRKHQPYMKNQIKEEEEHGFKSSKKSKFYNYFSQVTQPQTPSFMKKNSVFSNKLSTKSNNLSQKGKQTQKNINRNYFDVMRDTREEEYINYEGDSYDYSGLLSFERTRINKGDGKYRDYHKTGW